MLEITSEEQNKIKRMKRAEDNLRDLWGHIKSTNIQIIGVPEKEEKKKGYEKIFEEIIVENFPNTEKEIVDQVQEVQSPIQNKPKEKHTKIHTNQTTTATKSLQLCPTQCDPIDGSPPGSPVLGILQARTLEWVAISFSNA